jgi:hypothetical protein
MEKLVRAAFCCLLASAQILAFAHLALVGHQTCLEHGEAIHAGHAKAAPAQAGQPRVGVTLNAQPLDLEGHAHEHCLSVANSRTKLVLPLLAEGALIALLPMQGSYVDVFDASFVGVDLLALAPKGSPPVG